jgi:peptidoglycan/xylan/chitin deacetylase (PgdA/CDA1 family)
MQNHCTIVMYHYIRELSETRFPAIKGLTTNGFRGQISYMRKFYNFITVADLHEACHNGRALPPNAALLSFDDGYSDHYLNAFPVLDQEGIQGIFFPPVCAVREGRVLDVNKIHFVLASVSSPDLLVRDIFSELDRLRFDGHEIIPNDDLYATLATQGAFDPPQITFIKRLLQRDLPQILRSIIIDQLFGRYVTTNELAFARELYVNEDQLKTMLRHGMAVGSHGHEHRWMNTLTPIEQRSEIESSVAFLHDIGAAKDHWVMCYPYGAHDNSLQDICREQGCSLAFTTQFDIAQANATNALALARLDTNHIPKDASAAANEWTLRAQALSLAGETQCI